MNYYKIIAFCSNPVTGYLKFKEIFQIYPLDMPEAPATDLIKSHPFVLEFCISDQQQVSIDGELKEVSNFIGGLNAQVNFQQRILKLLTAFSNFQFFLPLMQPQWFVHLEGMTEKEMNNQSSVPGLNLYKFPKWNEGLPIQGFSKVKYPMIEPQEHPVCFQEIDLDGKEPVTFSQYIILALKKYFLLAPGHQAAVDSALELINQGVQLRETMKSLSFVAFISSIETMVALEYRDMKIEKCETCKADQYKVMAKFRDYLFKYAINDPASKKRINELYSLRSMIAHTGMLLFGDGKMDWSSDTDQDEHFNMHLESMMMSKLSLVNWILKRPEKENLAPVAAEA